MIRSESGQGKYTLEIDDVSQLQINMPKAFKHDPVFDKHHISIGLGYGSNEKRFSFKTATEAAWAHENMIKMMNDHVAKCRGYVCSDESEQGEQDENI